MTCYVSSGTLTGLCRLRREACEVYAVEVGISGKLSLVILSLLLLCLSCRPRDFIITADALFFFSFFSYSTFQLKFTVVAVTIVSITLIAVFLTTHEEAWYIILVLSVCLSVCVYVCQTITSRSPDVGSSFSLGVLAVILTLCHQNQFFNE